MNNNLATTLQSMLSLPPEDLAALLATAQALVGRGSDMASTQTVASAFAGVVGGPERPWTCCSSASAVVDGDQSRDPWLARSDDQAGVDVDPDLYRSRAFRRRWEPQTRVAIYLAQCPGSATLAQRLGATVYKHGLTTRTRLEERMAELNQIRYGAICMGKVPSIEAGFDCWSPAYLPLCRPRPSGSPVRVGMRCLDFTLPLGVTIASFDEVLRGALLPHALATYVDSSDGRLACASRGLDPRSFRRFTARHRDGQIVVEEARELTILRPRQDGSRLAAIIEHIIARFVMARQP